MTDDKRNLPAPLTYGGKVIHDQDAMVSLTDMWRAAGSPRQKAPAKWRALPGARSFVEHVGTVVGLSDDALFVSRTGGHGQGTWAHWHLALAYAKYLSPEFHVWANHVVRERMEGMRAAPQIAASPTDPATILQVIQHLQSQVVAQGGRLIALDQIEASEGSRCITDIAKILGMRPNDLFRFMNARRWIYRRPGTETWLAFQDKQDAGLMEHEPFRYSGRDGTPRVRMNVLVTPKGLVKLAALLGRDPSEGPNHG